MTKSVTVTTNDPKKPTFVLNLKAEIITYVETVPETLVLRAYEGEAASQTAEVKTTLDKPLVIQKVTPDRPEVQFTLTPPAGTPVARDAAYKLTLSAPADRPAGMFSGKVTLSTNVPEQPEVTLNYNINVQKILTISPPEVYMNVSTRPYKVTAETAVEAFTDTTAQSVAGTLEAGRDYAVADVGDKYLQIRFPDGKLGWVEWARVKKTYGGTTNSVWVTKYKGEGFEVKDAKADLEVLTVRADPKQPGSYLITLQYEGPMDEKSYNGTVTLATNDPREPSLAIPVHITVGQTNNQRATRTPATPLTRPDRKLAPAAPAQPLKPVQPVRPLQPPGGGQK